MTGFVYFIRAAELGRVKIGYSIEPTAKRLFALQTASPALLQGWAIIRGVKALECKLHEVFAADRFHREWFTESQAIRDFVAEYGSPWDVDPDAIVDRTILLPCKTDVPGTASTPQYLARAAFLNAVIERKIDNQHRATARGVQALTLRYRRQGLGPHASRSQAWITWTNRLRRQEYLEKQAAERRAQARQAS